MSKYSEPYETILRRHLHAAVMSYLAVSGETQTGWSKRVMADGSFLARFLKAEGSFRVQTYDDVMAHISHEWPEGTDWPEGVPRPAPKSIEPKSRSKKTEEVADGQEAQAAI